MLSNEQVSLEDRIDDEDVEEHILHVPSTRRGSSIKSSVKERVKNYFACPPHGDLSWLLIRIIALLTSYIALWGIVGIERAGPGANLFSLFVLYSLCRILGFTVGYIYLPPLLGMLFSGIILNNLPFNDCYVANELNQTAIGKWCIGKNINSDWKSPLRDLSFITILIRAGLSLNPAGLLKLKSVVIRLALLPGMVAEGPIIAVMSHFLLKLPWDMSFMLGFVLAAVSPAVVVPALIGLQNNGYGCDKGIPTLIIASASLDDIIAISGFSICMGITFSTGDVFSTFLKSPLEIILGITLSMLCGYILWYIPPIDKNEEDIHLIENDDPLRFVLLYIIGVCFMTGFNRLHLAGAGALSCLSLGFITGIGWNSSTKRSVGKAFGVAWNVLMPLLFGLIGTEIDLFKFDKNVMFSGLLIISVGLIIRMLMSFISVLGIDYTLREKVFVAIAWMPKATVQAAMGSLPLDYASKNLSKQKFSSLEPKLRTVVTLAVLAILISAPLGAIGISISGPLLLSKSTESSKHTRRIKKEDGIPRPIRQPKDNDTSVASSKYP